MSNNEQIKVLVVGSHGHSLAATTVNWGDEFYIGEYDAVIFDVTSLDRYALDTILSKDISYFTTIKKHIVDLQPERGFAIYCIMDKLIPKYENNIDLRQTNYGWSPVVPILEEVPGKEIDKKSNKLPDKYLKLIDSWIGFLDSYENNTGYKENKDRYGNEDMKFKCKIKPLLQNRVNKNISFDATWFFVQKDRYDSYSEVLIESKSAITFLPKTKDVHMGIDALLEVITQRREYEPEPQWAGQILVHGENELLQEIEKDSIIIKDTNKKISERTIQLGSLRKYKKLLYSTGDELHDIVEESLKLLGVSVCRPNVANKEDLYFEEEGQVIPMEIRGKDNSALSEYDVSQVIGRLREKTGKEKFKTRGIFILNHQRKSPPDKRIKAFEMNIVKDLSIPWSICLIDTLTLYKLIDSKLLGEDVSFFKDKFLNTVGIYS